MESENTGDSSGISETNQGAPSLHSLCLRSKKRTLELFLGNHGATLPENHEGLSIKLTCKINDEYKHVKDLPPPPATSSTAIKQKKDKEDTVPSKVVREEKELNVRIEGTHSFPSRPGVSLSDNNNEIVEPSESGYQHVIQTIQTEKAKEASTVSHGLIAYHKAAGIPERIQPPKGVSTALALRNPYAAVKPDWHPPWKLMRVISGHLGWVRAIAVDHSNEWFATGAADRTIKIWDLASGQLKLTLTGHINTVRGLAISARHPYLFSVGEDKQVKNWDLEYNKVIRHYHGHLSGVYCASLHPTIDVLVTGGRDATARVWDIRTKACVHILSSHTSTVAAVECQSTDPQIITGSNDSTIKMWDLAKGACSTTLTHHKKSVRSLVLHPSEFTMASGSPDNIKQWKFPEGKFMKNFSGHNGIIHTLSLNRDNVLVSGADNGSMYFWDWNSGYNFQKIQTTVQPGSLESEAGIFASTFDQTGSRLLTCEADKTIKVYKEDETATEETHPLEADWKTQVNKAKRW